MLLLGLCAVPAARARRGGSAGLVALPRAERIRHFDGHQRADRVRAATRTCCGGCRCRRDTRRRSCKAIASISPRFATARSSRSRSIAAPARSCGSAARRRSRPSRRQAQQPGIAEPRRRRERHLCVLPRLRADRLRPRRQAAVGDAARTVQQHLRHGRVAGHRRRHRRPGVRSEPRLVRDGGRTSAPAACVWKVDRPEAKSGHSTPIVWRGPDGKDQIILPGSFLLTSYDAATGKKLWWVGGLSFEMKSTPVIGGDTIYVNGYGAPVNDPGNKVTVPTADEVWKTADADGNGVLSKAEFPKFTPAFWFDVADLDINGSLTQGRVGVLPRRARFRERHAGDSPRRLRRHDRQGDPLEVSAQRAAAAVAAALQRRALHGERQRHRHDAQSGDRRGDQAGTPDRRARRRTSRRRSPPTATSSSPPRPAPSSWSRRAAI